MPTVPPWTITIREPGREFEAILARAYRRACRAGVREISTELVLPFAADYVRFLDDHASAIRAAAWNRARMGRPGRGDPLPPRPSRIQAQFDDDVAAETAAVLRVAAFRGSDVVRTRGRRTSLPTFSPAVEYAVYEAIHEAARRGVERAGPQHLVLGLVSVPGGAANRLLERVWATGHASLGDQIRVDSVYRKGGTPSQWAVDNLTFWGVLPALGSRWRRRPWRVGVQLLGMRLFGRPYRTHGSRYGHPILFLIEADANDKAVRTGHAAVTSADVLLSVIDLHEQLAAAGLELPPDAARWNEAGQILAACSVAGPAAVRAASRMPPWPTDAEDDLTDVPHMGWWKAKALTGGPAQGRTALVALREASLLAHRLGHPYAGTTHLLRALLAEPTGPAARLLRHLGVVSDVVRSDAGARLGGAP